MNVTRVKQEIHFSGGSRVDLLTVDEAAFCAGTTRVVVERLVEEELVLPRFKENEMLFDCPAFEQIKKLLRIHRHLDVDIASLGLVMGLLDRIDTLEARLNDNS